MSLEAIDAVEEAVREASGVDVFKDLRRTLRTGGLKAVDSEIAEIPVISGVLNRVTGWYEDIEPNEYTEPEDVEMIDLGFAFGAKGMGAGIKFALAKAASTADPERATLIAQGVDILNNDLGALVIVDTFCEGVESPEGLEVINNANSKYTQFSIVCEKIGNLAERNFNNHQFKEPAYMGAILTLAAFDGVIEAHLSDEIDVIIETDNIDGEWETFKG
jgi:hypothetical protein